MIKLDQVKVTPCDQQVLNVLVEGCSNKKIAGPLDPSLRTVKQHLRTLLLRAGIREGGKRVKLAMYVATYGGKHFAKKDHPWRQGYQGIRPNHSHPVISLQCALQPYNNRKGGHFEL